MHISIITTAALPWFTGTSINPLLRAAYLSRSHPVEIIFPECVNRSEITRTDLVNKHDIERLSYEYLDRSLSPHSWCREQLSIRFYDTLYQPISNSLYPRSSITEYPFAGDVVILEDPLQLMATHTLMPDFKSLLRPSLKARHKLVIGINHTNIFYFIPTVSNHYWQQQLWRHGLEFTGASLFNHHCDLIINLSPILPHLHRHCYIENVNGVHEKFFQRTETPLIDNYFAGKLAPMKNVHVLLAWAVKHKISVHLYGQMMTFSDHLPDSLKQKYSSILAEAAQHFQSPYIHCHDQTDSPEQDLNGYKTLINPSLSEVLCTTTAEALAMGKFVVLPEHPSNTFFKPFKNALFYRNEAEAIALIRSTERTKPQKDPALPTLMWSQANERLLSIIYAHLYTSSRVPRSWARRSGSLISVNPNQT